MTNKLLFAVLISVAVAASTHAYAQSGPLSLGQLQAVTAISSCPGTGWFVTNCYTATVANCPNVTSIGITFGYIYPTAPYRGTIVFLGGATVPLPRLSQAPR